MAASTRTVINQPPPLVGYDVFGADRVLVEAVKRHLDPVLRGGVCAELGELGRSAGSVQALEWGVLADACPPRLRSHDRFGRRVDEVEFHPAWHRLLGRGVAAGLTGGWSVPGGSVRRAAAFMVSTQVEAGHCGPLSMTHGAVPVLRSDPELAAEWEPLLTSRVYEAGLRPPLEKAGVLLGVGVAEKQAGSDVGAVATWAEPLAESGAYALTGHKWFCSAPMSDGFLVLARVGRGSVGGLTCFLVPRVLGDGGRNVFAIQRLKDKLGNRSNASAEVEFEGTWARRVSEEGRGVAVFGGLVAAARLDGVLGAAALMRQAVAQAVHHCAFRMVSGRRLVELPLMRGVLADLAVESEAATVLGMRLAAACDEGGVREGALLRLMVPVAKFWVAKRCTPLVAEALECLGGNGYVEESGLPRLLREAPSYGVWEGAGNVLALEVLGVLRREPEALDAFLREVGRSRGVDRRLDAAVRELLLELGELEGVEGRARRLVERLAVVFQGALLVRFAPPAVADAFCASRLGGEGGVSFGTLPRGLDVAAVVERARPVAV
ncbi:acyl-CoA dehydrogenase family protein [Streptomyces sp. NPDC058045]|uniref:acyl-CoA dehydrogenase family protein n=1 Tax=Streptomyces sp. NPDC058045 TaxID=3346311 RepID=UPI0036EB792F